MGRATKAQALEFLRELEEVVGVKEGAITDVPKMSLREFVNKVYPKYQWYRHNEILADVLEDVIAGKRRRVMCFMPPRHGKSLLTSKLFPAYYLYRFPDRYVGLNSYSAELAYTFSRASREAYTDSGGAMSGAASAVKHWETESGGGCWAAGVGGSITGKGYYCFPDGTQVTTKDGLVNIADLVRLTNPPKVLSFNHATNQLEWRHILATSVSTRDTLVEITLHSGHKIRCTPDHPIFSFECGYREASLLVPGQTVIRVQVKNIQNLSSLRRQDTSTPNMSNLPAQATGLSLLDEVPILQQRIRETPLRNRKSTRERTHRLLLLEGVQRSSSCRQESTDVQGVWTEANISQARQILRGLQGFKIRLLEAITRKKLWPLQGSIPTQNKPNGLLLKSLPESSSLDSDARRGQQSLQRWNELCRLVSQNASSHLRKGWRSLLNLWGNEWQKRNQAQTERWNLPDSLKACNSSHRLQSRKQSTGKPGNTLLGMSQESPSVDRRWQTDTISSVRVIRTDSQPVYDIQIEGNSNFFADNILVHNCGIIDDPLKNQQEAQSVTIREGQKEWYQSTFYTRAEPDGAIIVVLTRWHSDDLAGWLLEQERKTEDPERWHIINFAAVAEENPPIFPPTCTVEPDWREPGEALCPERFSTRKLQQTKSALGSRIFASLYQQRPSAADGDIFKRDWFKFYTVLPAKFDQVILSADCAFKGTSTSDFVVIQVWGKNGAEFYLIDQFRARTDINGTISAMRSLTVKHPTASAKIIEDAANGAAVIDLLKRQMPGLIPIKPEGGKQVRAVAVAPYFEAGNVYLPDASIAHWIHDYCEELASFPNGVNDDQVDSTSMALNWLNQHGGVKFHQSEATWSRSQYDFDL